MSTEALQENPGILGYFPLPTPPRAKQLKAWSYIERKYAEGYRDIVIAAPTGIGKSAIGSALCFWAKELPADCGADGGYYLVTQKLLQDQLERDFAKYNERFKTMGACSLKSATEYICRTHGDCGSGLSNRKRVCPLIGMRACAYKNTRAKFLSSMMAVTNYPYIFTEHTAVGKFPKRKILILDECHTVERQILKFIEMSITEKTIQEWVPTIKTLPSLRDRENLFDFIETEYWPGLLKRHEVFEFDEESDSKYTREKLKLENHMGKVGQAVKLMKSDPDNWIYWQERDRRGNIEYLAKPLDASPFTKQLINEIGHLRVWMSAYPGAKKVFCESLGMIGDDVAWFNINSTFPIENRRILLLMIGSMSRKNIEQTMPSFLRVTEKIFNAHKDTKGVVHCNSYELGEKIFNHFRSGPHGYRLIFPKNADEREEAFEQHRSIDGPTIILSPSMTEGFDFADDLAHWQIIGKIAYPYLGDKQVEAKKDRNQDWYELEAVKSIIQSTGRVCRSDTDKGVSYILDRDFLMLWDRQRHSFPRWWTEALVWPD